MEVQWLGTAGFCLRLAHETILLDPYLSRNGQAVPPPAFNPYDFRDATAIFVSHGHFDHLYDVASIARLSEARVYCSEAAEEVLYKEGVPLRAITVLNGTPTIPLGNGPQVEIHCIPSRHITFDLQLVMGTLSRCLPELRSMLRMLPRYPKGQVYSFLLCAEKKKILFYGSAGPTDSELAAAASEQVDYLFLPLQGHTAIHRIGVDITKKIQPRTVLIHHYDSFYPPLSTYVDVNPFIELLKREAPHINVLVPEFGQTLKL